MKSDKYRVGGGQIQIKVKCSQKRITIVALSVWYTSLKYVPGVCPCYQSKWGEQVVLSFTRKETCLISTRSRVIWARLIIIYLLLISSSLNICTKWSVSSNIRVFLLSGQVFYVYFHWCKLEFRFSYYLCTHVLFLYEISCVSILSFGSRKTSVYSKSFSLL